ncbi:Hypothetical protein AA314_02567 [Archangium gephyra]|uniref:Uncharacterized protein n=1 Tax=Archangium gephyra TaxID=48 RepID=A0AAC8Q4Q9_9BACT|nr:Hypothetical protein AA314_02567 [Archangium gephyra]
MDEPTPPLGVRLPGLELKGKRFPPLSPEPGDELLSLALRERGRG